MCVHICALCMCICVYLLFAYVCICEYTLLYLFISIPYSFYTIAIVIDLYFCTGLSNLSVTITTNVTDGIICLNKSVQLTCHANIINIATYNWTSTKFTHAEEAASITIIATEDPVGYTCTVTDTDGDTGYSSVNISSNGKLMASTNISMLRLLDMLRLIFIYLCILYRGYRV